MVTTQLLVTLGVHAFSGVAMLAAGIFVFLQDRKKILNVLYFFIGVTLFIYEASLVIAPLMPTYELAYFVWSFNIVDVFITAVIVHFMFAAADLQKHFRWYIRVCYIIATLLFLTTVAFPHLFLPQVLPKMYFPWYLDAGPLYVVMFIFFASAPLFPFVKLVQAARTSSNRNKIEYFIFMFILGYGIGSWNFALVFDYQIDPLFGSPLWLTIVPVAYGILTDQLFDIRVVLRRALLYSTIIGVTTGALMLLIFLNDLLVQSIPWVQFWTIPLFAGFGAFAIGYLFWRNSVASERLKYEFITVATHKLRTPLTQISWGTKALREDEQLTEAAKSILGRIEHANARLIELTNLIFESTQENTSGYAYMREPLDLHAIAEEVVQTFEGIALQKQIQVHIDTGEAVPAVGDMRRMRSVLEVLVENALAYSPEKSEIHIQTFTKSNRAHFKITDQGFGVPSDEQKPIFTRFYRSDAAKRADTEGVGLGLAMAKNIIKTHKGRMGVESEGEGKGSTFWFWIPTT